MKIGDVIRTRSIRAYFSGPEARGYCGFSADEEKKRENKTVFVMLFLGVEKLMTTAAEALDVKRQLNALGYWGEDQIKAALGEKKTEALVKKMVEEVMRRELKDEVVKEKEDAKEETLGSDQTPGDL